jgi:NTP pyrophosphatase (non-canonical NTP hydrolase)
MTKQQFLLLKLSEECMEVAQRASKQIQFGKDEVQKDQLKTNQARLKDELLDLFALVCPCLDATRRTRDRFY